MLSVDVPFLIIKERFLHIIHLCCFFSGRGRDLPERWGCSRCCWEIRLRHPCRCWTASSCVRVYTSQIVWTVSTALLTVVVVGDRDESHPGQRLSIPARADISRPLWEPSSVSPRARRAVPLMTLFTTDRSRVKINSEHGNADSLVKTTLTIVKGRL